MPKKPTGLEQLFVEELQDLYDAEKQLVRAIPKLAKAAADEELGDALREHLEVTKGQVQRLEQVFESMEMRAKSKPCKGMKGIVEEGNEAIEEHDDENVLDAAITGGARRVEHYEMAGYATAIAMAKQMGHSDAAQLLQETLQEEMQADKQLAQIAKRLLKSVMSAQNSGEGSDEEGGGAQGRGGSRAGSRSGSASGGSSSRRSSGKTASTRGSSARNAQAKSRGASAGGHSAHPLTDHDEIQQWAEDRNATPSCVRGTGDKNDTGMIRLNFPGFTGEDSLEEISWDDWFEKFDANNLALIVQETTAGGEKSNFNKLVDRASVEAGGKKQRTRSAH